MMLRDAKEVRSIDCRTIWVRFDDGAEGTVDVAARVDLSGVFEPLKDPAYFARVFVNPELGTVTWPNGADIDTQVLYSWITGTPLPDYASAPEPA